MPDKLYPFEYPDRFITRLVSVNGGMRWHYLWVRVSTTVAGEQLGLGEVDDGMWDVWFGPIIIGRFHERLLRIEDAFGRIKRSNN